MFGQSGNNGDSREIIVAKRRMADVTRNQYFIGSLSGEKAFAVGQIPVLQGRIDQHLVFAVLHLKQLLVAQTKAPGFFVIARPIGNPLRPVGQRKKVAFQFVKREHPAKRNAVVDHVEIGLLKIDDSLAPRVLDESVPDVPFFRDRPIKYSRSAGDFMRGQWNSLLKDSQSLTDPVPCDAPANGVELSYEVLHVLH